MLNAICVLAGRDREPRAFLQRFQELLSECVCVCVCVCNAFVLEAEKAGKVG